MTNQTSNILEENINELFGVSDMTEAERVELLDGVGGAIIESALLRYVTSADEIVLNAFEQYLEKYADDPTLLERLLADFPNFAVLLEEEIIAFKKEAAAVLAD